MNDVLTVLRENIFPIFVVAAFGFALRRWFGVDKQHLSSIVLNCLSPCLVFYSLVNSQLPTAELGKLAAFTAVSMTIMGVLGLMVAQLLRLSRLDTVALLVVLMFVNGGNYGLTLNQLRYGDEGLAHAIVYFITSTLLLYTVGVVIASMGKLGWRDTLVRVSKLPALYAAIFAVVVYVFHITIPAPLMEGIKIAGEGAIPVMLLVLGMQMADLRGTTLQMNLAAPAILLRLVAAPVVAVAVAMLLGLEGVGRATSIIEASLPPAVFTIILATEFDLQPTAVTSIVVLSTLISPLTIALLISVLGL